jgi:hypothetical protein
MRFNDRTPELSPEDFAEREANCRMAIEAEVAAMLRPVRRAGPLLKPVVRDVRSGETWDSVAAAAAAIGANASALSTAMRRGGLCRGRRLRWEQM